MSVSTRLAVIGCGESMSLEAGLRYSLGEVDDLGIFEALGSCTAVPADDGNSLVLRYEDLVGAQQFATFQRLFNHCDIQIPSPVLRRLLADHSFEVLSRGRARGEEDLRSHYRKGTEGDWQNYFDSALVQTFKAATADLVTRPGYAW